MGRKAQDKSIDKTSEKRLKLALSAFPIFQSLGLKNFKMDDLAKSLNKSKTTIYKYFIGREDLISFIVDAKLDELSKYKTHLYDQDLEYLSRYEKAVEYIGHSLSGLSNLFLLELSEVYPEQWQKVVAFQRQANRELESYYEIGIQNKIFKGLNPKVLVLTDKAFFDSILSKDFLKSNNISIQEAIEDFFELKCYGMIS